MQDTFYVTERRKVFKRSRMLQCFLFEAMIILAKHERVLKKSFYSTREIIRVSANTVVNIYTAFFSSMKWNWLRTPSQPHLRFICAAPKIILLIGLLNPKRLRAYNVGPCVFGSCLEKSDVWYIFESQFS